MGFTVVNKKYLLPNQYKSVKAQIILHCFAKDLKVSENDLDCLTHLAIYGCSKETIKMVVEGKIFKTAQVVSNSMTRYRDLGLIVKGKVEKWVINPDVAKVDNLLGLEIKMGNLEK